MHEATDIVRLVFPSNRRTVDGGQKGRHFGGEECATWWAAQDKNEEPVQELAAL